MHEPERAARALFPGNGVRPEPVAGTDGVVHRVIRDSGETYILKWFAPDQVSPFEREVGMRECLHTFTDIEHPEILDHIDLDGERYLLMEFIEGEHLIGLWREEPLRVPDDMSRLGTMLGSIHAIPLASAEEILDEDLTIYAPEFFSRMAATLKPFLSSEEQAALLECFQRVTDESLEQTVLHGDFGPHQVIVRPDGRWVLFDFEFAMTGPFADDLGGAEVRMQRFGFADTEAFLSGYEQVHSRWSAYQPVRDAFRAYLLLTILSTAIMRDAETPSPQDLALLRRLLERLASPF